MYKKRKFSLRTVEEIQGDIRTVRDIADDIKALSWRLGFNGEVNDPVASAIFGGSDYSDNYRSVAAWLYYGTGACFLQDADNMIMKTTDLVEVLMFLRKTLPEVSRVTTYSRSRTVVRKSVESLKQIKEAGLDRVHIGLETAYDPLLKMMKKGVKGAQHIEAGKKLIAAGVELSEYVMPGLGGQEMWAEHAVETAKALNQINPHFIRLRSLRVPERVPLYEKLKDGTFTMQTDDMIAEEIKRFIETLEGISSMLTSDHIMNLLEEVSGRFPHDKKKILDVIRKYQELPDLDRIIFRIGRRGGSYRSTDDLERYPGTYGKIKNLYHEIASKEGDVGVEKFVTDLVDRYV